MLFGVLCGRSSARVPRRRLPSGGLPPARIIGRPNVPLHRHTWFSPSHNTARLQETASEEQELTSCWRTRRKRCPLVYTEARIGLVALKPAAWGAFIGPVSRPSCAWLFRGGMRGAFGWWNNKCGLARSVLPDVAVFAAADAAAGKSRESIQNEGKRRTFQLVKRATRSKANLACLSVTRRFFPQVLLHWLELQLHYYEIRFYLQRR